MEVLGIDIQTIYFYGLIIGGILTLLYMLFSDIFEAMGALADIAPGSLLNPTVILSFISVLCGVGYVLELQNTLTSSMILLVATITSLVIVGFIHFFILVPLSKSEQSTAMRTVDFLGKEGEVITTIPADGLGEILITSPLGVSGKIAKSAANTEIDAGKYVQVIKIDKQGVFVVKEINR